MRPDLRRDVSSSRHDGGRSVGTSRSYQERLKNPIDYPIGTRVRVLFKGT